MNADLIMKNGRIRTMENTSPWAEAVAVKDKRIVYVGDNQGAAAWVGPETRTIDLEGRLVLPAFVDGHMHPSQGSYRYCFCLTLFDVYGPDLIQAYLEETANFARKHPELDWIIGAGFRRAAFDEIGPRKEWLDQVAADRPVAITSKDGHSMWVNSKALAVAGITAATPDPLNGVIKRDPQTGEPSGLLQESAMALIRRLMPHPTKEQMKQSLLWLQEWLNREGITTVHEAELDVEADQVYQAYQELAEEGRLTVRYRASWRLHPDQDFRGLVDRALGLSEQFRTPYFAAKSFKFFADEVIEEETGFLLQPYAHRSDDWYGLKDWEDEELAAAFTRIYQGGGQVHIHAIGDGAARYTLEALDKVRSGNHGVRSDWRPALAHVQMVAPQDIRRMADLGVTALVAPYWSSIDDYFWDLYVPFLGEDRAFNHQYPMKSFFEAGVNVAIHSDFSVSEPDFMWAFYGGLTRRLPQRVFNRQFGTKAGYRWVADDGARLEKGDIGALPPAGERLSLEEALRAATINGAYANGLDQEVGSLKVGKLADLIVLDRNLFEIDVEQIPLTKVAMTLFEGRVVHGRI